MGHCLACAFIVGELSAGDQHFFHKNLFFNIQKIISSENFETDVAHWF